VGYLTEGLPPHGNVFWTARPIAGLIESKFDVRCHRDHLGRLLRRLSCSYLKHGRWSRHPRESRRERQTRRVP